MSLIDTYIQISKRDDNGVVRKIPQGTYNIQVTVDDTGAIISSNHEFLVITSVYQSMNFQKK